MNERHDFTRGAILPALVRFALPVLLALLLQAMYGAVDLQVVGRFGTAADISAVSTGSQIMQSITVVVTGLAMSAFVAQNIGAGRLDRARRALWCGVASSLAAGLVMAWAGLIHGDLLAGIFAEDPQVIAAAWQYLKAYAIDCLLTSFLFCFVGYFNGRGDTLFVMVQGFAGAFGVRLPMALAVSRLLPGSLFALGLSTPASTLAQILLCVVWFWRQRQKERLPAAS